MLRRPPRAGMSERALRLRRPSLASLTRLALSRRDAAVSYTCIGISLSDEQALPPGWGASAGSIELGSGEQVWQAARDALRDWDVHRGAWVTVAPGGTPLAVGETVAVGAGLPLGAIAGVCRIVAVVDEPDRFGFAYGTVDPHPEVGEESFLLTRAADGSVRFRARSVSRAVVLPARLAPPLARLAIAAYTRLYARAMRRAVRRRLAAQPR